VVGRRILAAFCQFTHALTRNKEEKPEMLKRRIARQFVGRINVVGDALVFGLALRPNGAQVAYLDLVGSRSSVEAVWARLLNPKRQLTWLRLENGSLVQLAYSPDLKRYQTVLDGVGQDNLTLVVEEEQEDEGNAFSYVLAWNGVPEPGALVAGVKAICKAPVYLAWAQSGELLDVAKRHELAVNCLAYGGIELLALRRSAEGWETAISEAKQAGQLKLPRS
jgi:hypothetical protein